MTSKSRDRKKEGLSWRWKIAAAAGLVLALVALLWQGFWGSAAVLFSVFLILAYGKPFRSYREFVYRGVFLAGSIILLVSWFADTLVLPQLVPDAIRRLFLAFVVAVPLGVVPVLLMREAYAYWQFGWVSAAVPDLDRSETLALLRSLYFGLNFPIMVVDGPQPNTTRAAGPGGPGGLLQKIGGPGLIFVNHGFVAVLEWGGKYRRVAKAGATTLENWERPKTIVDLRVQRRTLHLESICTHDGVTFDCELGIIFQIRRSSASKPAATRRPPLIAPLQGATHQDESVPTPETLGHPDLREYARTRPPPSLKNEDRFPVDTSDVLKAVYAVDNWQDAAETLAGYVLREVVLQHTMTTIYEIGVDTRQVKVRTPIAQEVQDKLNETAKPQWGVEFLRVDIGSVKVPSEVRRQLLRRWVVDQAQAIQRIQSETEALAMIRKGQAEADVMKGRGEAEADVIAQVERAKDQARAALVKQLREALYGASSWISDSVAERLLGVVDGLSGEMVTDDITKLREMDIMEKLAASEGNKTLVFGASGPMLLGPDNSTHTNGRRR